MFKQVIPIFLLSFTSFFIAKGQVDSLNAVLDKTSDPTTREKIFLSLYDYYYRSENDSALYTSEAFLGYARKIQNSSMEVKALINKGLYFEAIKGDFYQSLDTYQQAYDIAKKKHLSTLKDICHYIGVLFHQNDNYEKAKEYYLQSIELSKHNKSAYRYQATIVNLAAVHSSLKEFDQSKELFLNLLKDRDQVDPYILTYALSNLANLYIRQKEYQPAIPLLQESIKLCLKDKNHKNVILSLDYLIEAKIGLGDANGIDSLILMLESSIPHTNNLRIISLGYSSVADAYFFLQQYERAYKAKELHFTFYDSSRNSQQEEKLYELEAKYQNEIKQNEIKQLHIESQEALIANQRKENQRNLLFLVTCILLLLIILFIVRFRQKMKSSKILANKNLQIEIALKEKEILLKEIHHRVKNNLQVVSSLLNLQANNLTNEAAEAIKAGQHRVKSMALIHQKLYQNDDLRGIEVQSYLEILTAELLTAFGMTEQITPQIQAGSLKLDVDTLIPIGLIINELITNSLKHAFEGHEGQVCILMNEENEQLKVTVSDNGKGIQKEPSQSNSFGWKMIQSLCRQLKAELQISNQIGTEITLIITRYKLIS